MKNIKNKIAKLVSSVLKENDESAMWEKIIYSDDSDDFGNEDFESEDNFFEKNKKSFKRPERAKKEFEENETQEGNAFTGALDKARDEGKDSFTVDGKKYDVKSESVKDKWIQKTDMKKGALHKELGIPEDEKIPKSKLMSIKKDLESKSKGSKKLSDKELKLLKQVNLALNLKNIKESKKTITFTESEMIDLIENIVNEEKETKGNIKNEKPVGLKVTDDSLSKSKKMNDDNIKQVTKKIKEYAKEGSNEVFEMNPKHFPKNNGQLKKMDKMAYKPSDAVEEYIENLAYPGLQNLSYDEIKPNEEWVENNLVGSSKTGNNSDWANSEKTDLGDKFNNIRKKNYYHKEKERSYGRVKQPVDVVGKESGDKLDSMFAKLGESTENNDNLISEEILKIKNMYSYNKKTQ